MAIVPGKPLNHKIKRGITFNILQMLRHLSPFTLGLGLSLFCTFAGAQTWLSTDLGTHGSPSLVSSPAAKAFTVATYGSQVADTSDNFSYTYLASGGNVELIAKITSATSVQANTQTGLMLRSDITNNASFVMVALTGTNSVVLTRRENNGTLASSIATVSSVTGSLPLWLKLKSAGTTIKAFQSGDGISWQDVGSTSFQHVAKGYWGLASASGDLAGTTQVTVAYQNVTLISNIPAVISKLRCWVRADHGLGYNVQSRVASWLDQSGYGNNLVQAVEADKPLWSSGQSGVINGMPYVRFNAAGEFLSAPDHTSLKPTSNIRIYSVVRRNSGTGVAVVTEKYTVGSSGYTLQMHTAAGRRFYTNTAGTSGAVASGANDFALFEGFLEVPGNRTVEVNGSLLVESTEVSANFAASTQPLYVGGRAGSYTLLGDIAELLIFGDKLTEAEVKNMDAYIFSKYGLGVKPEAVIPSISIATGIYDGVQTVVLQAPTGHEIYYRLNGGSATLYTAPFQVSATSTIAAYTKKVGHLDSPEAQSTITIDAQSIRIPQRNDLALWLRSDVGVMTSGTSVNLWRDQSGKSNDAAQTDSLNRYRPTVVNNQIQGHPVVRFNSANQTFLEAAAVDADQVSVIAVFKNTRTTGTTTQILAERLNAATPTGYSMYLTSNVGRGFRINGAVSTFNVPSPAATSFAVIGGIYDQVQRKLIIDGADVDVDSGTAATGNPAKPVYIGGRAATYNLDGDLAELFVYKRALNATERKSLEMYIYDRYQVGAQPIADKPVSSLMVGAYVGPREVQLTVPQADIAAYIRYTVDGSTPNSSSPIYTGAIPVNATTTVKAITVRPPFQSSAVAEWTYVIDPLSNYVPRSNLEVWLRADAGVKVVGTDVESWTDMSGVNQVHVATAAALTAPKLVGTSSVPAVRFDGADLLTIAKHPDVEPQHLSIFAVVLPGAGMTVTGPIIGNSFLGDGYDLRSSGPNLRAKANNQITEGATGWTQGYQLAELTFGDSARLYNNGRLLASNTRGNSVIFYPSYDTTIGKLSGLSADAYFKGDIAEILVYSRSVTETERREIEAYLAAKYNLPEASPGIAAPVLEVGYGPFGKTRTVTATCNEPGAVIHYTLDGSVPNSTSPIYVSPLTVYESRTFQAVALKPRFKPSAVSSVDVDIVGVWYGVRIGGNSEPEEGPAWHFETAATGLASTGDDMDFIHLPCAKGGSIEWASAAPAEGLVGIMMRTDNSPLSAFAFVGFKAGDSNCYFISRSAAGLESVQTLVIAGVNPGDLLRLEMVGNSVILKTKDTGVSGAAWVCLRGIDLFQSPDGKLMGIDLIGENRQLVEYCLMGIGTSKGNEAVSASMELEELNFTIKIRDSGIRWLRAIEPPLGDASLNKGKYARLGFSYDPQSNAGSWVQQTAADAGKYTSNDLASVSVTSGNEIKMTLSDIQCPTTGPINLFVRLAPSNVAGQSVRVRTNQLEAGSSTSSYITKSTRMLSVDSENGMWVHAARLENAGIEKRRLQVVLDNLNPTSGLYEGTSFKLDGFLLVAEVPELDLDEDNIADSLEAAAEQVAGLSGIPFVIWGDADGDGWSNYQELMLGVSLNSQLQLTYASPGLGGWRGVSLAKPPGEPSMLYSAIGHYTRPLKLKAEYADSGGIPVPGYAVGFSKGAPWSSGAPSVAGMLLLSAPGHLPVYSVDGTAEESRFYSFTGLNGEAACRVFVPAEAAAGKVGEIWANTVPAAGTSLTWNIGTYKNEPPGPTLVQSTNWKLGASSATPLAVTDTQAVILVTGGLMAIGHPTESSSAIPSEGFVDLLVWDPRTGSWMSSVTISPPTGAGGEFGRSLNKVTMHSKNYLAVGALDGIFFYAMTGEGLCELQPSSTLDLSGAALGAWSQVAFGANEMAVGAPATGVAMGKVETFRCQVISNVLQWSAAQTLTPNNQGHSARFGTSVAFSADGGLLAVGAPSDLLWYQRPEGQPYYNEEEEWVEPAPPADPSVYLYKHESSSWVVDEQVSEPARTNSFGQTLLFTSGDQIIVGAPYAVNEGSVLQYGPGYLRQYTKDANGWSQDGNLTQDNPGFGRVFHLHQGRLIARSPLLGDGSEPIYPEAVHVYDLPWGIGSHSEILYPGAAVDKIAADGNSIFVSKAGTVIQYDLMPAVPATATSGEIATIQVADENISVPTPYEYKNPLTHQVTILQPPFTDSVELELINLSELFEITAEPTLPPVWPKYSLNVKSGADLTSLAGQVAWLQLEAHDLAGDRYEEALGVRMLGAVPEAPSILTASAIGRNKVLISWNPLTLRPDAYIIERATLEDISAANGDPGLVEAAFSEIRRTSGWAELIHDDVSMSGDGMVYRLKAENNEGTSPAGTPATVAFDTDGDTLPDWWEMLYAGNLTTMNSSNYQEYLAGTNPLIADSDFDGIDDDDDDQPADSNRSPVKLIVHTEFEKVW